MKKRIIYILILILVLTGCSAKAPNSTREPVKNDSSHETESTKELPETIKPDANITIEVESVKELLEAIKPDADITIKSGYPEYGYDAELPDFTNMKNVPFDAEVIAGTAWTGVYAVVPESGDSFYLPHIGDDGREITVSVKINDDGTGVMNYYGEVKEFKWYCDSKYSIRIEMEDEIASGMLHTENIEGENPLWLLLHIGETAVWMHLDGSASWG